MEVQEFIEQLEAAGYIVELRVNGTYIVSTQFVNHSAYSPVEYVKEQLSMRESMTHDST